MKRNMTLSDLMAIPENDTWVKLFHYFSIF